MKIFGALPFQMYPWSLCLILQLMKYVRGIMFGSKKGSHWQTLYSTPYPMSLTCVISRVLGIIVSHTLPTICMIKVNMCSSISFSQTDLKFLLFNLSTLSAVSVAGLRRSQRCTRSEYWDPEPMFGLWTYLLLQQVAEFPCQPATYQLSLLTCDVCGIVMWPIWRI